MMQILILPKISFLSFWFFFLCLLLTYLCSWYNIATWSFIFPCFMLFRLVLSLIWFIHNYIIPKKARQWYQYISRHIRHKKDFLLYRFFRLIACCLIICCAPRMLFSVASCTIFSMLYEGKKKKLKILVACALRGKSPNRNL